MSMPKRTKRASFPKSLQPMEARLVDALPTEQGWQFEPKWDGFRCLVFRDGARVELQAKSGKPLTRFFPEVVAYVRALKPTRFVLDGELAIPVGHILSFDSLQMRLHPAESRVRKLAAESPARLMVFDLLFTPKGQSLLDEPLRARREALEAFVGSLPNAEGIVLTPYTRERRVAQKWLDRVGESLDGVIAKQIDGVYQPGERAMLKVKRMRTADCVVGGFRYATESDDVGSLLLGLYNEEGKLDHVGFTSSIPLAARRALTKKLEKLIAPPGFTGKAPGAPSRWSTARSAEWQPLKPELVAEVCYDHATEERFRHGTRLLRWRPDKSPRQCTFEQLAQESRPSKLIRALIR